QHPRHRDPHRARPARLVAHRAGLRGRRRDDLDLRHDCEPLGIEPGRRFHDPLLPFDQHDARRGRYRDRVPGRTRSRPRRVPSRASTAGATPVTIPAATATGTYYILAKADSANVLGERNEANNVSARILRVGPDLVAAVRGIAGTPTAGATISVQDLTSDPSAVAAPQSTTTSTPGTP